MILSEKYQPIWKLTAPYLAQGRWYDLTHTELCIGFMELILTEEGYQKLANILIPTIILHDVGWSQVGEEKHTKWDAQELCITHRKEGAALAEAILRQVNYPSKLITPIVKLVGTHDNAYLGKPPTTLAEKLTRDADALFIFTSLSFWKDYQVATTNQSVPIPPAVFLEKQFGKLHQRATPTARRLTAYQVADRYREIEDETITPTQRYSDLRAEAELHNQEWSSLKPV